MFNTQCTEYLNVCLTPYYLGSFFCVCDDQCGAHLDVGDNIWAAHLMLCDNMCATQASTHVHCLTYAMPSAPHTLMCTITCVSYTILHRLTFLCVRWPMQHTLKPVRRMPFQFQHKSNFNLGQLDPEFYSLNRLHTINAQIHPYFTLKPYNIELSPFFLSFTNLPSSR